MCMQINCRMFLNCLLLASTRALSRVSSVSMDTPMTRYSMMSEALAGAVAKYHALLTSYDSNSIQNKKAVLSPVLQVFKY